jgi:hypothetical protein
MIANTPDHIIYYDKFQRDKTKHTIRTFL